MKVSNPQPVPIVTSENVMVTGPQESIIVILPGSAAGISEIQSNIPPFAGGHATSRLQQMASTHPEKGLHRGVFERETTRQY